MDVIGVLRDNFETGRLGLWYKGDWYIDGLHCGTCFDVMYRGEWLPVRLEMAADWFLDGLPGVDPRGLEVWFRG